MELCELVVLLIFKINKVFDLDIDGFETRAVTLFSHIVSFLSAIQALCADDIAYELRNFSIFYRVPKKLKFGSPAEARFHLDFPTFYAVRNARTYFEQNWVDLCHRIIDFEKQSCKKEGLKCFKKIFNFFVKCSLLYYKKYDEGIHFQVCKALDTHKKGAQMNFEVTPFAFYFKYYMKEHYDRDKKKKTCDLTTYLKRDIGCPLFARK